LVSEPKIRGKSFGSDLKFKNTDTSFLNETTQPDATFKGSEKLTIVRDSES